MTRLANEGRDARRIDELLKELAELRELDRRRQAHVPGSAAYDVATLEVDLKSRRLFDRFRDLKQHRPSRSATPDRSELSQTRRVEVPSPGAGNGRSHLN